MWWSTDSTLATRIPVRFNFMPSWWHREYGLFFGQRLFTDIDYRANIRQEMDRLAHERFGDIGLGHSDPPLRYFLDDLNNATMPAALGCEVCWADDNYPDAAPLPEDTLRRLAAPDDIRQSWPVAEMFRQAREIQRRTGEDTPVTWNLLGIQNLCVKLRGSEFFADYYADPDLAEHLLDVVMAVTEQSMNHFHTHNAFPVMMNGNVPVPFHINLNCTVAMAGPKTYERWLLPREQQLEKLAAGMGLKYGIHHCGLFDEYASLYARVDNVVWLEIGWGSDLRLALDTFPDAWIQYIIDFQFVANARKGQICDYLGGLLEDVGPDSKRVMLVVADLDCGTPDDNIREIVNAMLPGR